MSRCLLVFGAGSLAAELTRSLAAYPRSGDPLRIVIASRRPVRARWVAEVAAAHAHALGAAVKVSVVEHRWAGVDETAALIDAAFPDLVLHAASLQSAWSLAEPSRWSRFVGGCGYGVTVPLQLELALHVQRAIALLGRPQSWLNACFPDLVNACLAASGEPPLCGIGNVSILAEHARQQLGLGPQARLKMIAGHAHVPMFQRPRSEGETLPPAWLNDEPLAVQRLVDIDPLPTDASLNAFNAAQSAKLIWALLVTGSCHAHAPGPDGLPGGYPIRVASGRIALDLPPATSVADAVALNAAALEMDGAVIVGDSVRFSEPAREALFGGAPALADGFRLSETPQAVREMVGLRAQWLAEP